VSADEPIKTGGAEPGNPGVRLPSAVDEEDFVQADIDRSCGRNRWVISGGFVPVDSSGPEPCMTSNDKLSLLNIGKVLANIRMFIFFEKADPAGPYQMTLAPGRVSNFRFNDLIFPVALDLEMPYAAVIESDVPIIVQFTRQNTTQAQNAIMGTIAYPDKADDKS